MKCRIRVLAVIAALGGFFLAVSYVNPYTGTIQLSELVLQLSGSRGEFALGFSMNELLSLAMRMAPDLVFEMYFGTVLYRHFCTASVYVFSRYTKRVSWYFRDVSLLEMQVVLYQVCLLSVVMIVSACRHQVSVDLAGLLLLGSHIWIRSFWVLAMTLMVNLLSIFFGSDMAFVSVMMVQALGISVLAVTRTVDAEIAIILLKWNPVAHLVLGWHSSELTVLKEVLKPLYPGIALMDSMILYIILTVMVIVVGAMLVKQHDLLCSNAEEGEM